VRPSRRTALGVAIMALALAGATAPGAQAIGGGRPDGDEHPAAGMMAIEHDGIREAWCSGFYAGPRRGDPGTGVFVTAGHCLADVAELGFAPSDITVTFDSGAHYDMDTFTAVGVGWHPAFAYDFALSDAEDYGVILLEDPVRGLAGMTFPAARELDRLAARGGLRPETLFDSVGYGFVPRFKRAPASYEAPPGRMLAVSRFSGLTTTELGLLANADAGYGGGCYGDSGGPVLLHDSNTVVGMTSGGDPLCRAKVTPARLDIPAARAFYGAHVQLP
jgi:trypsin